MIGRLTATHLFSGFVALTLAAAPVRAVQTAADSAALEEGLIALTAGEYEKAANLFARAAGREILPAHRLVAKTHIEVGDYDEAEETVREFVASHPDSPEMWNTLGEVHALRGRLNEAEQAFQRAAEGGASDSLVAEVNLAVLWYNQGRLEEATARLDRFIDVYNSRRNLSSADLAAVARAATYLGIEEYQLFQDAVRVYDEAIAKDARNVAARVAVGDLFLSKFESPEAHSSFQEALALNASHPGAVLGLARALHFDGSGEAMMVAQKSLEVNPNYTAARVFVAQLHLESERYDEATEEAERALAVNPNSLEALAILASVRFLTGDAAGFEEVKSRIFAINPRYAELYNTVAELAARNRWYAEAVDLAGQAVALDPKSWRGYGLLGMNQLRTGAMDEGRANLDTAFEGDPFSVWVKNTLDLADTFEEYDVTRQGRFELVIHEDESAALAPYLAAVAEDAFDSLMLRYSYRPPTPVRVEVYPRHADFSVRTVGLAGIGALGVSFGPVIAMDSPSARELGNFNWGSTIWHELAHTFHLGMTAHRVPRWFSEGLAVYEERQAREGWGGDVTPGFLFAYNDDKLLPVSELNNGFVRPAYPQQVIHSYYQASLVFDLIVRDWGYEAIRMMLDRFERGMASAEVIESVFEMSSAEFDEHFDAYFKDRFASALVAIGSMDRDAEPSTSVHDVVRRAESNSYDFRAQLAAGQALYGEQRLDEAINFLTRAQELFPEYAADDSPYVLLGTLFKERGEHRKAEEQLAGMVAINANHYGAYVALADVRVELEDVAGAAEALDRALYVYPFDMGDHRRLAGLYEQLGEWPRVIRERRAVVALDPVDMAEARYELARALFEGGEFREARREVLRALEQAPNFEKAQDLLLEIRARQAASGGTGESSPVSFLNS
jgi:tetratricopeptide (TPR) repeat protein